jgi:hypothetical protein
MMQAGSPELQPYANQVTVSLETSSGRYRAIAYELAVRAGIIENYQLTRFGDLQELGEFLSVLSMDDDSAILGLAENFSEFDQASDGDQDGIISREDLEAMLKSDDPVKVAVARYLLNNGELWNRLDIAGGDQNDGDADGLVSRDDLTAYKTELADAVIAALETDLGSHVDMSIDMGAFLAGATDAGFAMVGDFWELISDLPGAVGDYMSLIEDFARDPIGTFDAMFGDFIDVVMNLDDEGLGRLLVEVCAIAGIDPELAVTGGLSYLLGHIAFTALTGVGAARLLDKIGDLVSGARRLPDGDGVDTPGNGPDIDGESRPEFGRNNPDGDALRVHRSGVTIDQRGNIATPRNDYERANLQLQDANWQGPDNLNRYTPAQSKGRWLGQEGNSAFEASDELAAGSGFETGDIIQHINGKPDLSPWSVPGPDGRPPAQFQLPEGAPFNNKTDGMNAIFEEMVRQNPDAFSSRNAARQWLSDNGLTPHHFDSGIVQLVPTGQIHVPLSHWGGSAGSAL